MASQTFSLTSPPITTPVTSTPAPNRPISTDTLSLSRQVPKDLIKVNNQTGLSEGMKVKLEQQLEDDLHFYLQRRLRSIKRQTRTSNLEQVHQNAREQRLKRLEQKSERSDQLRAQSSLERENLLKRRQKREEEKRRKIQSEEIQDLKSRLQRQKEREGQDMATKSQQGRTSRLQSQKKSRFVLPKPNHNLEASLQNKMNQVLVNRAQQHKSRLQRFRIKSMSLSAAQQRHENHVQHQSSKLYRSFVETVEGIEEGVERAKETQEKQIQRRRKANQQKLIRMQSNIKEIEKQQDQKFERLSAKHSLQHSPHFDNRFSDKSRDYFRKWLQNHQKIEHEKEQRAQAILRQHAEVTVLNKLYREKREQIKQYVNQVAE